MDYAALIDHTILAPQATKEQVKQLCGEAMEYGFHSVCVNSSFVYYCAQLLKDSHVKVCTVIGFPLGAMSTAGKVAEAEQAMADGASELDMVIHVGMIKSGDWEYVKQDISSVVEAARGKAAVKDRAGEDPSLPGLPGMRGGFCENLHRIFQRRGYG